MNFLNLKKLILKSFKLTNKTTNNKMALFDNSSINVNPFPFPPITNKKQNVIKDMEITETLSDEIEKMKNEEEKIKNYNILKKILENDYEKIFEITNPNEELCLIALEKNPFLIKKLESKVKKDIYYKLVEKAIEIEKKNRFQLQPDYNQYDSIFIKLMPELATFEKIIIKGIIDNEPYLYHLIKEAEDIKNNKQMV